MNTFLKIERQNGSERDNKDLPPGGGMGHMNRSQGCQGLLPHSNSNPIKEIPAFLYPTN